MDQGKQQQDSWAARHCCSLAPCPSYDAHCPVLLCCRNGWGGGMKMGSKIKVCKPHFPLTAKCNWSCSDYSLNYFMLRLTLDFAIERLLS